MIWAPADVFGDDGISPQCGALLEVVEAVDAKGEVVGLEGGSVREGGHGRRLSFAQALEKREGQPP